MFVDFLKDNFEYYVNNKEYSYDRFNEEYNLIESKLLERNCIYVSVEKRSYSNLERIAFKVSYVEKVNDCVHFYNSDGVNVFNYCYERNLGFYYTPSQLDERVIIGLLDVDYPVDWLQWLVDYAYNDYFNKAQKWFGTDGGLGSFCDSLYMSESSRLKLQELILHKQSRNF